MARHAPEAVLVPRLRPPRADEPERAQVAVRGDGRRDHLGRAADPGAGGGRRRLPGEAHRGRAGVNLGIDGRVALVMGASRGIGRGIATALAREGARVAVSARSAAELEELAAEIGGAAFPADTEDLERVAALPGEVAAKLGPVEILVANTGGPPAGGALDNPREEWEAAYRSLVLAPRAL